MPEPRASPRGSEGRAKRVRKARALSSRAPSVSASPRPNSPLRKTSPRPRRATEPGAVGGGGLPLDARVTAPAERAGGAGAGAAGGADPAAVAVAGAHVGDAAA